MSLTHVIGQPLAVELLQRWLAQETTQPLLFYGPTNAGKRILAIETAKALNCVAAGGADSCGSCASCKKIACGRHPDVRVLDMAYQAASRGEPVEKQQALRIETVLAERRRLYQTAVEGRWKVSILDEAHRLTPDAANVLLKVLEEPPPRTAIFLLTPFRDRLVPTLVSRCQPVRFGPVHPPAPPNLSPAVGNGVAGGRVEGEEAEDLWKVLLQLTPGQILSREARQRGPGPSRRDIEDKIQRLLAPALRDLRLGGVDTNDKIRLFQQAQQQLRHNVPPGLVYDNLLLKLSQRANQ